jgi:hypothetical protein
MRPGAKIGIAAACVVVAVAGSFATQKHELRLASLAGAAPASDETWEGGWMMEGPIACGHGVCSDDGSPGRGRQIEYVVKAEYKQLLAKVESEVLQRGGKRTEGLEMYDEFELGDWSITMEHGRFDPVTGITHDDPRYVRVMMHTSWDENPVGKAWRVIRRWHP